MAVILYSLRLYAEKIFFETSKGKSLNIWKQKVYDLSSIRNHSHNYGHMWYIPLIQTWIKWMQFFFNANLEQIFLDTIQKFSIIYFLISPFCSILHCVLYFHIYKIQNKRISHSRVHYHTTALKKVKGQTQYIWHSRSFGEN